jgi:hypothetical protein
VKATTGWVFFPRALVREYYQYRCRGVRRASGKSAKAKYPGKMTRPCCLSSGAPHPGRSDHRSGRALSCSRKKVGRPAGQPIPSSCTKPFLTFVDKFDMALRDLYEDCICIFRSHASLIFSSCTNGLRICFRGRSGRTVHQAIPVPGATSAGKSWSSRERSIAACFGYAFLERFAYFFGLVERRHPSGDHFVTDWEYRMLPAIEPALFPASLRGQGWVFCIWHWFTI